MNDQHIFFSYSRDDSEFVLRLAKDLRSAGENIWLDQLDIEPGKRWDKEIEMALKEARKILLVLSPTSVASENVMDEVSYALEENIKVIPIMFQPCEVPFRLRRLQFVDFSTDYAAGFQKLLDYLHGNSENSGAASTSSSTKTKTPLPKSVSSKKAPSAKIPFPKWVLGLLGFLVVAFLAFQFLPGKSDPTPQQLQVPQLVDLPLSEARSQIQRAGFTLGRTEEVESSDKSVNLVLDQRPPSGTFAKKGQAVDLKIAVPPKAIPTTVVNVVGKQLREATGILQQAGLSLTIRAKNSDCNKEPGTITAQFPSAGKTAKKGDEVQVDVVAPRQKIAAKRVPGENELRTLTPGRKTSEAAWALKETNVEFSLAGDECTTGQVRIVHPLGGKTIYNLKAGQLQSGSRMFGLGNIDLYFTSNNPQARLHVRIW